MQIDKQTPKEKKGVQSERYSSASKHVTVFWAALVLLAMASSAIASNDDKGVTPSPTVADPQNDFLAIQVGGNGRFNMGANPTAVNCGTGPTFPSPCRYNLSFAWPSSPATSFTTVRIDGGDHVYGNAGDFPIVVAPADSPDGLTNTSAGQVGGVRVSQVLSIVPGLSGHSDTARIRYVLTNLDAAPHDVGLRLMIDTMLNNNDGAPFRVGGVAITSETDYTGANVPDFFDVFFNLNVPGISAHGTLHGVGATPPDRFVIAAWPRIFGTLFEFTPIAGQPVTSDSAIGIYWNPVTLQPGTSRVLDTFYGVSPAVGGTGLVVVAPSALGIAPGQSAGSVIWSPNPFTVDAFFTNGSATSGSFSLLLDLSTAASQLNTASLNPVPLTLGPGQSGHAQWSVNATAAGEAHYRVSAAAGGSEVTHQDITTQIPRLVVPSVNNPLNPSPIHLEADGRFCPNNHLPCDAVFPGNIGGVPPAQFEWRGITSLAFVPGSGGAIPTLLNDRNARSFVYTAVDTEGAAGQLSLYLMYDVLRRTVPFGAGDNPSVTFDIASGRFTGRMLATIACATGAVSVSGFDNGTPFFGRDGATLGVEGACGFGKSPNPSGDPFLDAFVDVDGVTRGFNVPHGMFELEVPLTQTLGGGPNPGGVYDPSSAFWSASAPESGGVFVLSQNLVSITINTGASAVTPSQLPTTLTYNGATSGDFHDPVTLSARLTLSGTSAPVANQTITFTIGMQSCSGLTNASGVASCNLTLNQIPGPYTVSASFAATGLFQASNASVPFTITREETTLSYTGDRVIANNTTAHLSGVLLEDGLVPIAGRTVVFTLGTGGSAQTCTGITNAAGVAACTIFPVNQPFGAGVAADKFAGDAFYLPSSAQATTTIFAFLTQGAFVLGDKTAVVGSSPVEFWGEDWSRQNVLSGGSAPDSFKGFTSTISTNPPACGDTWTSTPGDSSEPPDTLPPFMAVVVSSTISKSGSTLSGNVPEIVVVKTNAGYAPNPGHSGTGIVVAVFCK